MKAIGQKNIWFEFAGHRNAEFDVQMLSMPTRPHPARKGTLVDVPGRSGKLFIDEGAYDRVLVSLRLIAVGDNIDAVNGWLTGKGDLIFGDEPNRAYRAMVTKEFSLSHRNPRLRGQEFTMTFDCEPFKYAFPPPDSVTMTAGGLVQNPGTVYSEPRITITGSGDFLLAINGFSVEGSGIENGAIVDSALQETLQTDGLTSYNRAFAIDEFPLLSPGANTVSWTGNITKIEIDRRCRYL